AFQVLVKRLCGRRSVNGGSGRNVRHALTPAEQGPLDCCKLARTSFDILQNLPLHLTQGEVGDMKNDTALLNVLGQRAQGRLGDVMSELTIDLGVEKYVSSVEWFGRARFACSSR